MNRIVKKSKPKGLGDSIERITEATGIKAAVQKISEAVDIPCGCEKRRNALNEMFPYDKK
jgi:hypothetical protein